MKSTTIVSGAFLAAAHLNAALAVSHAGAHVANHVLRANLQVPSAVPVAGEYQSAGCYNNNGNMTLHPGVPSLSSGVCNEACKSGSYWVSSLQTTNCYCGYAYPPANDMVNDTSCSYPCPGYGLEACGGLGQPGFFSFWNTGINVNPPIYQPSSSTTAAPTSTSGTSSSSAASTHTEAPTETSKPSSGDSNVAGIAAGTVVGVVALAGLAGAAFFLMRRRRNAEIEEEHRRNAAVNAFINSSKPPSTSGSISMADSRLDGIMAHRRLSDGSIADNEDYSRRILRVTNA